jgi:hypothetical protein
MRTRPGPILAQPHQFRQENGWIVGEGGYGTMDAKEGIVGAVVFAYWLRTEGHARLGHVVIEPSARVFALFDAAVRTSDSQYC